VGKYPLWRYRPLVLDSDYVVSLNLWFDILASSRVYDADASAAGTTEVLALIHSAGLHSATGLNASAPVRDRGPGPSSTSELTPHFRNERGI